MLSPGWSPSFVIESKGCTAFKRPRLIVAKTFVQLGGDRLDTHRYLFRRAPWDWCVTERLRLHTMRRLAGPDFRNARSDAARLASRPSQKE